ncbi:EAL domain-containing protein [Gluconacetobacter diazotrophicus]|uniref:EAL domain-containing protein n=1 Tax=Gluconacetobacter diazotrophicus TaxID=33996 RepID=A0A7W4FCQ0_GLUDI|nr:EAL domain-containing protein [Gluconacetobacter diazotrophicus]MBB2155325.1 EAL domain-containing protein [Gluconacetobacter diazotrophicus]
MALLTDSSQFSGVMPGTFAVVPIMSDRFVCLLDPSGRVAAWGADARNLTGYTADDMLGRPLAALFSPCRGAGETGAALPVQGQAERVELIARRDGTRFHARIECHALDHSRHIGAILADMPAAVVVVQDVSAAGGPAQGADPALRPVLDRIPDGIALFGADCGLLYRNDLFGSTLALPDDLLWPGTQARAIMAVLSGDTARTADGACDWTTEILRQGRSLRLSWTGLPDGRRLLLCRDLTDLRRSESRARFLEQHDDVTGLANLPGLQMHLQMLCERPSERFTVLYFDLFGFKRINNTMGHAAGDELLRLVADRVRRLMEPDDVAAHIRGNKFALVMRAEQDSDMIWAHAQHLRSVLSRPMSVLGHDVTVGVGIGVVRFPADGSDRDTLMWNADIALQYAKDGKGEGIRFYNPVMDRMRQKRMDLERDLQRALAQDEFVLFYQPFLNIGTHRIVGVEALIRWMHPVRGLIPPGDFIPVAEGMGLMYDIGVWTLNTACRQASAWPEDIVVSVNVSAAQFRHDGLVETVAQALLGSGLDAGRLELEITETAMIDDVPRAARVLRQLREMGVKIALDDFGTGYSSLSFLQSLPFTRIKIDRSFVRELGQGVGDGAAIVGAITSLCGSLNVVATAEGVETQEQFDYLKQINCSEIQGFFICRPRPASEIQPLLDQIN